MAVRVKPGVAFDTIAPAGYVILAALRQISRELLMDLTITSGTDGAHSGPEDPHHLGCAYDVRSRDLDDDTKRRVLSSVMATLGPDPVKTSGGLATRHFFGYLEAAGTENEHFHFQQRRGVPFTVEDLLA